MATVQRQKSPRGETGAEVERVALNALGRKNALGATRSTCYQILARFSGGTHIGSPSLMLKAS